MQQTQTYSVLFVALLVFCATRVAVFAQTETVPLNFCPYCRGTSGTWEVSYPWFFSDYSSVKTKSVRNLVWGSVNGEIHNPDLEGAKDITRTISAKVSLSYTVTDSGSSTATIKGELGVPKQGSIGGSYTNKHEWSAGISGSSECEIVIGRVCVPGTAIWDRALYYSRVDTGTRYRYNGGMRAEYWCPTCRFHTRRNTSFTDIYDEVSATFTYPSGQAMIYTPTGHCGADSLSPDYYTESVSGFSPSITDTDLPAKSYQKGKNW